jgi:hypothetical protein
MTAADQKVLEEVQSFLNRQKLAYGPVEEQYCTKLVVKNGRSEASVSVYNSGKIVVGGKDSPLRKLLRRMQASIEGGELLPGQDLPFFQRRSANGHQMLIR